MNQEKPKTYTAEFRESAVKLANESSKPIAQTAKDLGMMCQHFSGHTVKQLFAVFRSPLVINSYWLNEAVLGYKKLRYTQIYPA